METTVTDVDALIDSFSVAENETFDVELPGGAKIKVKKVRSVEDLTKIRMKQAMILRVSRGGAVISQWKPLLPISEQEAQIVAEFSLLVVEPKFTDIQVMKLCRQAGPVAAFIHQQIVVSMVGNVAQAEMDDLEAEKNDFQGSTSTVAETPSPADSSETTSASPETTSEESIPTDGTPTTGDTPAST